MTKNLLPRFFELLDEAHAASEAVDAFDLNSEDDESLRQWDRLRNRQRVWCQELIRFGWANHGLLDSQLEDV